MGSEPVYFTISINSIDVDEADAIIGLVASYRGTKKGMLISYHEPILEDEDDD